MLTIFENPEILREDVIDKRYKNCKYVLEIEGIPSLDELLEGRLIAVSTNSDSFTDLCRIRQELEDAGKGTALLGTYGGDIRVLKVY